MTIAGLADHQPVADTGGPYRVDAGSGVTLDASASTDPDTADVLSYAWDLNGDGAYTDATGESATLDAAQLASQVCGGTCATGVPYQLGLRVDDGRGGVATATTTLTIAGTGDFTVSLSPATQPVNPGGSAKFAVQVSPLDGFDDAVHLAVEGLPTGWTGGFDHTTALPGQARTLIVHAPPDATEAPVDLTVVATSGSITHTTHVTASVTFALIPTCTGDVAVRAVDTTTGDPVPGASVAIDLDRTNDTLVGTTGADGTFTATDVPEDQFSVDASHSGYVDAQVATYTSVVCGAEVHLDVPMTPYVTVVLEGRVVRGISHLLGVYPTDEGVPSASVSPSGAGIASRLYTTDANGHYRIQTQIDPTTSSGHVTVNLGARKTGWWPSSTSVRFDPTRVTHVQVPDLPIVEVCSATIHLKGKVVDQDGNPVAGSVVQVPWDTNAVTGADGTFDTPPTTTTLYPDNRPRSFTTKAIPPSAWPSSSRSSPEQDFSLDTCGTTAEYSTVYVVTRGQEQLTGTVQGVVVDQRSGGPVAGLLVQLGGTGYGRGSAVTDADGTYRIDVPVGTEPTDSLAGLTVGTTPSGTTDYWPGDSPTFSLGVGEVQTVDLSLLPRETGSIEGTVTDASTGDPVAGITVWGGGRSAVTATDGTYRIDDVPLDDRNGPAHDQVYTVADPASSPWFSAREDVVVTAGDPAQADLALVPVCGGGTVHGHVVDASTGAALDGVTVSVRDYRGDEHGTTGPNGAFELTGLVPGVDNQPNQVRVTASKTGYVTQYRYVTLFCGGTITVDFGTPDGGTGSVVGTVTDADTGDPIPGAFVGGEFGNADTTGASGVYRLDDAPVNPDGSPRDWTITAVTPDGRRQEATVTVSDGVETRHDFAFATSSNAPPTADDLHVTATSGTSASITLTGADPDIDPLTFAVQDGPSHGTLTGTAPHLAYTPDAGFTGDDTFTFTTSDDAGATSQPATVTITVEEQPPPPPPDNHDPVAVIAEVSAISEGGSVHLDATGSTDPDHDPLSYRWQLDGSTFTGATADVPSTDDFSGDVALTVDDGHGGTDTATARVVVANVAPSVALDPPTDATVDRAVQLGATISDPGRDSHEATIDWGDGSGGHVALDVGAEDLALTHTYANAGDHRVELRVCDDDGGCVTRELTVQVADAPAASTPTTHTPSSTTPLTSTSSPAAPPAPATPAGAEPAAKTPSGSEAGGTLPRTGAASRAPLIVGLMLAIAGALLIALGRRRRRLPS